MGLEFESRVAVLGKFGDVCDAPLLDWRRKCKDEIIQRIPLVLVDQFFSELPYKALISDSTSINFREAWESEGGSDNPNCCPSTANSQTTICEFRLPKLQPISIGTEPRCYDEWEARFCKSFPIYRSYKPFTVNGATISLRAGEDDAPSEAFVGMVNNELSQAIWNHLYRTLWVGRDSQVDSFNGIMHYFENGISLLTECTDYPTKPTCINLAEYILGSAAAAAGGLVGAGDIVLPVGDPSRPVDAPPTNIISIYPGTLFETSLDITGMDSIAILTAWYELVVNEWNVNVSEWMLAVPRNETKCLAQVAACKQSCKGDCRDMLRAADNRDLVRAEREDRYINERILQLHPYTTSIPMRQTPVLRDLHRILFVPEVFTDMDGQECHWLMWTFLNRRGENEAMFRAFPAMRDMLPKINENSGISGGFDSMMLYDGVEFSTTGELFEAAAWDWLFDTNCNSVRWWNNAKAALVPQMPWLWLCIDGIDCNEVVTLPCVNPLSLDEQVVLSAVTAAPGTGFASAQTITVTGSPAVSTVYAAGDHIDVQSVTGTTYAGVVRSVSDPDTLVIDFYKDTTGVVFVDGYTREAVGPQPDLP